MDWLRLINRDGFKGRDAVEEEKRAPVDAWIVGKQLLIAHFVVVAFNVAQFCGTV